MNEEIMALYKAHGVNPLAGCLPMLLPFPILITLFFVFRNTIEFRGVPFLWLPDLSLKDPLYIGSRHPRLRGEEYWSFVDEFVEAVKRQFPKVLLQWEDFGKGTSFRHLETHRDSICSFNDRTMIPSNVFLNSRTLPGQS